MVENLTSLTAITVKILFTMTRPALIVVVDTVRIAYRVMSMIVMSVAQRYGVATTMIVMMMILVVLFIVMATSLTLFSLAQAHTTWALS
jgi:hypothetical protein